MELVLEHEEVIALLREALGARGTSTLRLGTVRIRKNNKKSTIRVVFKDGPAKGHSAFSLLEELTDEDECDYDHDGYCQTHYHDKPCAHERAREMLVAEGIPHRE